MKHCWNSKNVCKRCGLERLQQGRYHSAVYGAGVFHLYRTRGGAWKRERPRCFEPKQEELFAGHRFESMQTVPEIMDDHSRFPELFNRGDAIENGQKRFVSEHRPSHQGSDENENTQHPLLRVSHPIAMNAHLSVTLMFDQYSPWFGRKRS